MIKKYSYEDLLKFLSLANKKLKKTNKNLKNVRIERNYYKEKLNNIEQLLNNSVYKFDIYDYPSNIEIERMNGKEQLKDDIIEIIKSK